MTLPTTLAEWLDDLTVRFLLNLPASELSSIPRLCFQVEEAQWYYEDFIRPAVAASGAPPLPNLPLRQFCLLLFRHCPLLSNFTDEEHLAAYEGFLAYKVRVPVRGAILLNKDMDKVLLVRGWKKGASWSFPRGKINKDEKDLDCAIREVWEETGYDARSAEVVPKDETKAKYIDITMREQHMRLFVFRGVSEDTHFEPRTRKEIGKIEWYSVKDLPGFKKGKVHHEGDPANANKFYMVAPFLGPLKKWINTQRQQDLVRAQAQRMAGDDVEVEPAVSEDDIEAEIETDVPDASDKQSEELKRLLSIGQPPSAAPVEKPTIPVATSNSLLDLLRGTTNSVSGNTMPHTPLEQVNAFLPQPASPQPHHLRHPSGQTRRPSPPEFPLSPQRLQQEQLRNSSVPTPNISGPPPNATFSGQQYGFPSMMPPPIQQQHLSHPRQSMPGPPSGMPIGPNGPPFRQQINPPFQSQVPFAMQPQQPPPHSVSLQHPQGAIASGPAVPNASQLPPPRLTAQTAKLLDAFKSGSAGPAAPKNTPVTRDQRPASIHQTALLDLFRKPPVTGTAAAAAAAAPPPQQREETVSPILTDTTEKPVKLERNPTLNEITRTLPARMKVKSPSGVQSPTQQPEPRNTLRTEVERPKSRQLFDPFAPAPLAAATKARGTEPTGQNPPQSLPTKAASRSPRPRHSSPAGSPARQKQNGTQASRSNAPTPSFTILARPNSARASVSPASPPSSNRDDGQYATFQPQVLKRPQAGELTAEQKPADKKDQLLALFGKSSPAPAKTPSPPAPMVAIQPEPQPPPVVSPQAALLNLFTSNSNTTSAASSQVPTPTPAPPRAPRIEPERRPSSRLLNGAQQPIIRDQAPPPRRPSQQQNLLLDLFNRGNTSTPANTNSPGTPISPFTLGTPAGHSLPPPSALSKGAGTGSAGSSRLGGVTSPISPGANVNGKAQVGLTGTPVEAKEFLKGFLDGVVKGQGAGNGMR